jgi:hypothetical protein
MLTFPTEMVVGMVSYSDIWESWPATGVITVPDGQLVTLRISGSEPGAIESGEPYIAHAVDLAFLHELPADVVEAITLEQVVPESMPALAHVRLGLRRLYLAWTGLTDDAIRTIAELSELTYFQSWGNAFTDQGVQQLARLQQLESLALEEATLTVAAFAFAPQLPRLARLGVMDVPLSTSELEQLRRRLLGVDVG